MTPENIYAASILEFPKEYQNRENFVNEIGRRSLEESEDILKNNAKNNIKTITIDDPLYRESARITKNSPLVLYYKGEIGMDAKPTVALVGTRKATEYGKIVTQLICRECVEGSSIVLSGLAAGIDSFAHQACLDAGGTTYISPYPVGTPPKPHHFINRNEMLASWSDEIIVVEAGTKSGAIITADFAKKFNRKIYAVPNNIFENASIGCNRLIAEILKVIPLSVADLALKLSDTPENLSKELFLLELEGQVGFKSDGKWHYTGW